MGGRTRHSPSAAKGEKVKRTVMLCSFIPLLSMLASAAAARGEERPEVLHVGTVAPHIIGITVQAGRIERGKQVRFEQQPGDEINDDAKDRSVRRNGKFLGWLVGREGNILFTEDRLVGPKLDTERADVPASYTIKSSDDPAYSDGLTPLAVYRKSKPSDFGRWGGWPYLAPIRHVIYLELPGPLKPGCRYRIECKGVNLQDVIFQHDPARLRSEAVHVSHLGFRPDDPAKVAFLSCWLGSGGPLIYDEPLAFSVLDDGTGRVALTGQVKLSKAADDNTEDAYKKNYNGTDVYEMDFSALSTPGTYRVCVEGVGCSYPFEIADDVWRKAFAVSARGFYHQRSGIELGPPYTAYTRPRPFHPDDGVRIYHSTCPLMDSGNGLNALGTDKNNFGNLVNGKTDRIVPNAWGGYMDAGDWDRRIQHLRVSRYLIELAELFPDYFSGLSLNIPESNDGLPDVVSEALFNLDCYRRMQTPEGGIRGGIESSEHPRHGEGSWQESLDVMAYAPGIWSSHLYAGVSARAAHWLESRNPDLARLYSESAALAMRWAEDHFPERKEYPHAVNDDRNLAAAEMFRLTGHPQWHEVFLATTAFKDPEAVLFLWQHHEQREAAWVYVRTDRPGMDAQVKRNCRAAILREADARAESTRRSGFRWAKYEWQPVAFGPLAVPDAISLVRAHRLTGDVKYLRAAVLASQTGAGANPLNICYTTGLGHESPRHPLHIDSRITHQPPPPGITVAGPVDVEQHKDYWAQKIVARYCHPSVQQWPTIEAYWDVFWYPPMCEFTVQTPMARNAYIWGYLAAREALR